MEDLCRHSIEVILGNQSKTGAYIACPTFPTYQYSWFRDGAYIAFAMALFGEHESSARFHEWAAEVVNKRESVVRGRVASETKPWSESTITVQSSPRSASRRPRNSSAVS